MAGIIGVWQLVNAATTWQGPPTNCTYPGQTNCNTDGVVWNRSDTNFNTLPAQIGNFKISGNGAIGNDFYIPDTKAFRVDKSGDSIIRIGNWGGTGNHQSDLVIYGDLKVEQRTASMTIPQIQTPWLCLNGDCRNVWPSGGGGGGTVTSVGSGNGLTGGPITGSGTLSIMTCANGQILKVSGGVWACGADIDTNSGGTLTGITAGNGISVSGGAPSPTVSINDSYGFGCANGQVRKWNGASWVCSGDATATVGAGTGIIITGTAPNYTVNVDDNRYVNVTGDNMTGKLGISAAIFGTTFEAINNLYTNQWHWGGTFTANGALGVGVSAEGDLYGVQATGDSYGIYADTDVAAGYGGFFTNNIYGNSVYLGGQSYGVYSNGPIYSVGKITGAGDVQGNRLCIGTDCRAAWPTAGTGDITGVTAGNGLTGGGLSGDVTLNIGAGTGMAVAADTIGLATCANGYIYKSNGTSMTCQPDATGTVTDVWVNTTGDTMSGALTVNAQLSSASEIASTGANAGYKFYDRANNGFANWVWYANNLQPRLWNSTTGDVLTMNTAGLLWLKGGLTANGDIYTTGSITSGGNSFKTTAGDIPILTKYYDPFASTAGVKYGHGRWGMFMEPGALNIGIPNLGTTSNREFQVSRYATNGSRDILLALRSDNGNFYVPVGNMYTKGVLVTSDVRLKKDISQLSKGLDSVLSLIPVSYKFKTQIDDDQKNFGFIAQQVDTVLPDLVRLDPETGYYHISYEGVIPVTVKAIQEQQAEIEDLKAKNQELEARLERLEALIK